MKEGFYFHRNYVYYGCYDEDQVSGRGMISAIKQEYIRTENPISEKECAVRLWDNHGLLEPEYEDLEAIFSRMQTVANLNIEEDVDFGEVEERLNVTFPKELKKIYTAIFNQKEYYASVEHFLPLNEIYEEQGVLVFFKKKRTPIAGYDLKSGCLARYYKKEWDIDRGDVCCYQFCVGRIFTIALENKPAFMKGRCKGTFVTTLNIKRELENYCTNGYHLILEYDVYGIAMMYSDAGLMAWIRSNGSYADIHVGAEKESDIDAFGEHLGEVAWN